MNGFQILAESHRRVAGKTESEAERKILEEYAKALEIAGDLTDREKERLFDTGIFNDIVQGYVRMMLDKWDEVGEEVKEAAEEELRGLFDRVKANKAAAYFKERK